jgi:hypothetical protein
VVYSLFLYHQKNLGGPGSSKGKLERIRAGLTVYSAFLNMHTEVKGIFFRCVLQCLTT